MVLEIEIIKVVDPSCLWVRVLSAKGQTVPQTLDYASLQEQMDLFYHSHPVVPELQATLVEDGQVCVVRCPVRKSWCRAVVESVSGSAAVSQVQVFLVDYADHVIAPYDDLRLPLEVFLQLPFRAQRFRLDGVHPLRLQVTDRLDGVELRPAAQWDISATCFLLNLLHVSKCTEAEICGVQGNTTSVRLYLSLSTSMKICVNDELVVKQFAFCLKDGKEADADAISEDRLLLRRPLRPLLSPRTDVCQLQDSTGGGKADPPWTGDCSQHEIMKEEVQCARLLQFLSPDAVSTDSESPDMTTVPQEPKELGILVHSVFPVEPVPSLLFAPVTESVLKALQHRRYVLGLGERYCWPAVARGGDAVLVSRSATDALSYLPPLLSYLQLCSVHCAATACSGPIAVILCAGWEKAQSVYELLEDRGLSQSLKPVALLVGQKADEAENATIPRSCQLLVTTAFSLVRLLAAHCFLFLRLCHIVLDEADVLFSRAPEELATILQHFQRVTGGERAGRPRQLVSVSRHWIPGLESLLREHMCDPCVVITKPEEAALYGDVHQTVMVCLDSMKVSTLLGVLDFVPRAPQKTVIVCDSVKEVEQVYKAISSIPALCLIVHEQLLHQFSFIRNQWSSVSGVDTYTILVTTDKCLEALGIQDATVIVHYTFPSSPRRFGLRTFCMLQHFRNLSEQSASPSCTQVTTSMLLLCERDASHVTGILRYLERSHVQLPPELQDFVLGVVEAKEAAKSQRPLCRYMKSFGVCTDSRVCPDRHRVNPELDTPRLPEGGNVMVLPLYVKTACCYYGRIMNELEKEFDSFATQMKESYAQERISAADLVEGGLYGLQEGDDYHRVQVLDVPERGDQLFYSVPVRFLDEGREQEVRAHQLLTLPSRFHILPPQAVEIVLCRTQPIDGELEWNPMVTRLIHQKIKGVRHQARVILSLGRTVWVDPMVKVTRVPGLKTCIFEHSVHSEILATGMGCNNPQHVERLREALCKGATSEAP